MSQPITQVQVGPEDPNLPSIITQAPEEKPKSAVTKPEDHKNVSIISSDTSTTLAPNATPAKPANSKAQTNSGTARRPSRSFFSMFFCCAWGHSLPDGGTELPQIVPPSGTPSGTVRPQEQLQTNDQQTPTIQEEQEKVKIENDQPVTSIPPPEPVVESPETEHRWLLDPIGADHTGRKCLVLDLDETLVHSSFKQILQADFVVPVEIENQNHNVYVIKRPGVDQFLKKMGEIYEIVVFTASLSKYADPVLDKLDKHQVVRHRLFRESCYNHKGNYVKDLSQLGRELRDTIIIDNSPASYIFHPTNAVPISSWFNDPHDTELVDLIPFLEDLTTVDDVMMVLDCSNETQ